MMDEARFAATDGFCGRMIQIFDAARAEAVALIRAEASTPNWQPIATAPKDGRWIILYCSEGDAPDGQLMVDYWEAFHPDVESEMGRAGVWQNSDGLNPTHWMPLPAPPSQEQS